MVQIHIVSTRCMCTVQVYGGSTLLSVLTSNKEDISTNGIMDIFLAEVPHPRRGADYVCDTRRKEYLT